ncbi:hypothetical protein [Streptomyces zaomyceticus]
MKPNKFGARLQSIFRQADRHRSMQAVLA